MKTAIYARYSSDLQNPKSVDDQIRLCLNRLEVDLGRDPGRALIYKDEAISGSVFERPGLQKLLADLESGFIDLIVAEGLDRLSRSQRDVISIYEIATFRGAEIWTTQEGKITQLHVGFKGTMNALFLTDLKKKVIRGQAARAAEGFAMGIPPYGYRPVRGLTNQKGRYINGVREIVPEEAEVVRRIFQEYADGQLIAHIVRRLNAEGIPSSKGRAWRVQCIKGSERRRQGLLYNEMYIGILTYNRGKNARDPVTGKTHWVEKPETDWVRAAVPALRIIDDDVWNRVQRRIKKQDEKPPKEGFLKRNRITHNRQHALTGWVKCGVCGGDKNIANNSRYVCNNYRYSKTCKTSRGTNELLLINKVFQEIEYRILYGKPFRTVFQEAFSERIIRQRHLKEQEEEITQGINRLVTAIEQGVDTESATQRVLKLQTDLKSLKREMRCVQIELPTEQHIRDELLFAVTGIDRNRKLPDMRLLYEKVLDRIVLTPIKNKFHGEEIEIILREDGWPDIWEHFVQNKR